MYKIMFSAGEPSGDLQGAQLIHALKKKMPEIELIGFGGPKMAAAGMQLSEDMQAYSVMGFWEVLKNLRRMFRLRDHLTAIMRREKPDLLVLVDYPDFNWRLAKKAKELGIPVFSYIPPSAWAWRKGRAKDCARIADEFSAIFPFEMLPYEAAGATIHFDGNPLVDTVHPEFSPEEARRYFQLGMEERMLLLLPGSRKQEIQLLLPVMLQAAARLKQGHPELVFYLPVAPGISRVHLQGMADAAGVAVRFTEDHTYDLMGLAELALATSGTVVLEAALRNLPCIVLYRMSKISYFIGRLLVHVPYFSLPNILAGRMIQPELLQDAVNPDRITSEAEPFLTDRKKAATVRAALVQACKRLGPPGAAERIAARILTAAQCSHEKHRYASEDKV